jgi:hypothetical protein
MQLVLVALRGTYFHRIFRCLPFLGSGLLPSYDLSQLIVGLSFLTLISSMTLISLRFIFITDFLDLSQLIVASLRLITESLTTRNWNLTCRKRVRSSPGAYPSSYYQRGHCLNSQLGGTVCVIHRLDYFILHRYLYNTIAAQCQCQARSSPS